MTTPGLGVIPQPTGEPEDGLTIFDPRRCRCFQHCTNAATVNGLCDRCWMEYAALQRVYRTSGEW